MPEQIPKTFFNQKRTAPEIKSVLLPQFFKVWQEVVFAEESNSDQLFFADVNAGLASDAEGNALTPVKILEEIDQAKDEFSEAGKTIQTIFLDSSKPAIAKLKTELESLDFYEALSPQPVTPEHQNLPENFTEILTSGKPVLLAIDPFSSEFTQQLLTQSISQKQTDLWMLFTPAKLKSVLMPDKKTEPENTFGHQLFGEKLTETEQIFKGEKSAKKREQFLLEQFEKVLQEQGRMSFVFRFNQPGKTESAFYLVVATYKKALYFRVKDQLHYYTDLQEDNVPLNGINLNYQPATIPGFAAFLNKYSLENLIAYLAGSKSLYHFSSIKEIYETHSIGTPYVLENYLAAFEKLRKQGQVNLMDNQNRQLKKAAPSAVVFYRLHSSKK